MGCRSGNCNDCEGDVIIYTTYPKKTACGKECVPTDLICYNGPNLPNTGIENTDTLTLALQKIDNELNPNDLALTILQMIASNVSLQQAFCNLVNNCFTTTTTTTSTTTTVLV
jgi:hypothetical protein